MNSIDVAAKADSPVLSSTWTPTAQQTRTLRAQNTKFLISGFVGAHALGLIALLVSTLLWGRLGLISAALGAVLILLYRVVGQTTLNSVFSQTLGRQLPMLLGSFLVRMSVLLLFLVGWLALPEVWRERFSPTAIGAGAVAVELGWLAGLLITSMRSRVAIYDGDDALASGSEAK